MTVEALRNTCDAKQFDCDTTAELTPYAGIIGQERAVKVLGFGLEMKGEGFNIFVSGNPGTGRMTAVQDFLIKASSTEPVPSDWCYVNNFKNQYEPKVFALPPGTGAVLKGEMATFITEAKRVLPEAFESEDYSNKRDATVRDTETERKRLFEDLNIKAQKEGFIIQSSPMGLLVIPLADGKPLSEQEFLGLPAEQRDAIQKKREQVTEELRGAMRKLRTLDSKINDDLRQLNKDVALFTMGHLVNHLEETFANFPDVVAHINAVQDDIVENIMQFIAGYKPQPGMPQMPWMEEELYRKYEVNVIVDNAETDGAPVIVELNPTYQNVFGKLEKEAQFGMLTTDFTMIVGGAIHRANGGYLVLPVDDMLRNGISWEALKMALKQGQATIEEPAERFGYISTRGIKPQPIPLSIKIVLIGTPSHYQALVAGDPDFAELFKVRADFDATMPRDAKNMHDYAVFACNFCKKEGLSHLEAGALCRLIEYSSRLSQQKNKLSTHFALIADIIREADFYARKADSTFITAGHISTAIEQKIYRSSLIEEKIQEMFDNGQILLDTSGFEVGQVNGLSVLSLGDYAFGRPSRVTVSTGIGKDGVMDIEREARMGGPTHTKGVMILGGYLLEKYAQDKPLGLSARLVFEQSYSGVDGDSASSTELYALLSSLSGTPIRQYIAVTGSVNQKGEVQPIGGVNEKIEGYFAVCKAKGLTGEQGVMIPASNVQNLMLKDEVVDAIGAGSFHIWPVATIDEGIEVLTGVPAGVPGPDGSYPEGSIHHLVDKRLGEMAQSLKNYSK